MLVVVVVVVVIVPGCLYYRHKNKLKKFLKLLLLSKISVAQS